jgi:hypothetical protein
MRRPLAVVLLTLLATFSLLAQSLPQATVTGKVTSSGQPLPGVTITVSSPQLQGTRTTVTTSEGDYILPLLPPGEYAIAFELEGMQRVVKRSTLTAARTDRIDTELQPATMAESITVTAETPMTAAIESTQVSTNFKQEMVEMLPVQRTIDSVTLLAPGVTPNGPGGRIMISGAMSFDSLYLVNGAVVNENLRGQAHDLYIEDAVQETTVLTGGISAEYGHFTGGVVNAITKSGSNEFDGSFRTSATNESWVEPTEFTADQADEINLVHEATVGGPIMRDRIWFFGAGRFTERELIQQTGPGVARTGDADSAGNFLESGSQLDVVTYPYSQEQTRLEGKLTGSINPRHNLILSYMDVDEVETNQRFTSAIMDLDSLVAERQTPNSLLAVNYNAALSSRFFAEAQYSKKEFAFIGSGSPYEDLIRGTLIQDRARGTRYNSATFKQTPEGEQRNHETIALKASYFLSTPRFGTHELKAGYEDFEELRRVNNFQSGSLYRISVTSTIVRGTEVYPRMPGGSNGTLTRILYQPILELSEGSLLAVQSMFLNDRWSLNDRWTFNLGVRYDKNDAVSAGRSFQLADDSAISPRLAAHYDVFGNGRLVMNASYGQYVGRLAEGVTNDGDPAGRNATFQWNYRGPSINNNVNAPTDQLIPTHQAIEMIFDWFFENGGHDLRPYRDVSIPGIDTIIDPNGLTSPNVKEYTVGIGGAIGTRGYARADLIMRNWDDFYADFTTTETGQVTDDFGNEYDLTVVRNSDIYDREYTGVQTQFSYRALERLNLGATYTWSRLVGNVTGEDSGSGPLSGNALNYPEYRGADWNYPTGYLTGDQRHRFKGWASYDIGTPVGDFNLSLLQSFDSGNRTSIESAIDPRPYVENPGYLTPTSAPDYFFGGRGTVEHDDITRTDLALNYSKRFGAVEIFVQPEIINIFNEQAVLSFDEEVLTESDVDYLLPFNPFTETPIECPQRASADDCSALGAHWQRGENFGSPNSEGDFQTPRTFRFSVGLRF